MDSRGLMAALKIRRAKSKRDSLYLEGYMLELLSKSGVSPGVYRYGGDFVLMEYIWGIDLEEVVDLYMVGYIGEEYLRRALASALRALYILDKLGIDHLEVGNPVRHVIYRNSIPTMARIIDFESSHPSPIPSNIPRFVGGFLVKRFWWLLNMKPHDLRAMMRRYKKDPGSREEIFRKLLRIISRI
jgi:predicted Ser/Thr protein kinase